MGFEGGVGEAGDDFETFVFEGLKVDFAAHAAVKNEDGVLDLKAAAKDFDSASQGGGVGAVASQDGDVERSAVSVGGDSSALSGKATYRLNEGQASRLTEMRDMFLCEPPPWNEILDGLKVLRMRINAPSSFK